MARESMKELESELRETKEQVRCLGEEKNALRMTLHSAMGKIDSLENENKELLKENVSLLHQLRALLKEAKDYEEVANGLERIKSARLVVRENNDMPNCYQSSVAIECYIDEDGYGISRDIDKPTLTVAEITEIINEFFEELLRRDELWLKVKNSIGSN